MLACCQHLSPVVSFHLHPASSSTYKPYLKQFPLPETAFQDWYPDLLQDSAACPFLQETFLYYSEFLVCLLTVRAQVYGVFSLPTQVDYKPLEGRLVSCISLYSVQYVPICVVWQVRGLLQAQSHTSQCDWVPLCMTSFGSRGQMGD